MCCQLLSRDGDPFPRIRWNAGTMRQLDAFPRIGRNAGTMRQLDAFPRIGHAGSVRQADIFPRVRQARAMREENRIRRDQWLSIYYGAWNIGPGKSSCEQESDRGKCGLVFVFEESAHN